MISSLELRRSAKDTEVVNPQDREAVLRIINAVEARQEGAVQAFCDETNLRVQLVAHELKYVADNLNLASPFSSLAA